MPPPFVPLRYHNVPPALLWCGMPAAAVPIPPQVKSIPQARLVPLAAAYVAYIVLCNLSLKVNTVGFYQVRRRQHGSGGQDGLLEPNPK